MDNEHSHSSRIQNEGLTRGALHDSGSQITTMGKGWRSSGKSSHSIPVPRKIGRYEVVKRLGQGGFGSVFLARDPLLNRKVAIKVPRSDRPIDQVVWKQFVDEGRAVSNLNHHSIIPVYDINRQDNGIPFVVMEYVKGDTLRDLYDKGPLPIEVAIEILIQIAEGLQYAHDNSIVHRDLKPTNIMVDENGRTRIADFGLALHENTPIRRIADSRAGTMSFMAPEQLRGESHRMDSRTDIWSFGVVLYWMFSGQLPFKADSSLELADKICYRDPAPIRNKEVPAEIERICNRCLCRLKEDRYQSAEEIVVDLNHFKQTEEMESSGEVQVFTKPVGDSLAHSQIISASGVTESLVHVVPKGLRSFDAGDTDFFLSLLPGPVDRFGVPDSIRFWQQKFSGEDEGLDVGLLYGPSGCGKSSFVRAGLIPRLPDIFKTAYIACSAENTEADIARQVRRRYPHCQSSSGDLVELLHQVRIDQEVHKGTKLLIVLDHFEQWLNSNFIGPDSKLVEALRQCDGIRVQCLLLVRDDFWMPTRQFMRQIGHRIQDGKNSQALPLFGERHARRVLKGFGQAHGALPSDGTLIKSQREFIYKAVASISNNGKVNCAHLSLVAELMKGRDWTKAEFGRLGGWQGIGTKYLEESLGYENAAPEKRPQLEGVRQMLGELIPSSTVTTIKGTGLSREQLMDYCPAIKDNDEFDAIIETLDDEMRLISKTMLTELGTGFDSNSAEVEIFYQLSHDVLVEPIRLWLTAKQRSNWRGRAGLRLEELSRQWEEKKEKRHLPSLYEFFPLVLGTNSAQRSGLQSDYLSAASRVWQQRLIAFLMLMTCVLWMGNRVKQASLAEQMRNGIQAILDSRPEAMPIQIEGLYENRDVVARLLLEWPTPTTKKGKLHKLMLEAHFSNTRVVSELIDAIEGAEGNECINFIEAFRAQGDQFGMQSIIKELGLNVEKRQEPRGKIRIAIIALYLGDPLPLKECLENKVDPSLRTMFVHTFPKWRGELSGVLKSLGAFSDEHVDMLLCKSLILMSNGQFSEKERVEAEIWLREIYPKCKTAGLYVASTKAIKDLGFDSPEGRDHSKNWRSIPLQGDNELFLVRIDAGLAPFGKGVSGPFPKSGYDHIDPTVESPFYISSKEISAKLFREFLLSPDTDEKIRKAFEKQLPGMLSGDLPIVGVNRHEAAQFCNWLSKITRRDPAYRFVETAGNDQLRSFEHWVLVPESDGYRLPTVAEWELACRAGSETKYFIGAPSTREFLPEYSWCDSRQPEQGFKVGKRAQCLPNDFGLFDMSGNVVEWTNDFYSKEKPQINYCVKGGSASSSFEFLESGRNGSKSSNSRYRTGIRIVVSDPN